MTRRMLAALIALFGLFVSIYLVLYKAGLIGALACGTGGCETVQLSRWSTFMGIPVAGWGAAYYVMVLALALAGIQERWADSPRLPVLMVVLTGWGVAFSAWLTWLELSVIHAICRWCVVSAILAVLLFLIAVWDWRATRAESADGRQTPR